jgi:hypothetical protein
MSSVQVQSEEGFNVSVREEWEGELVKMSHRVAVECVRKLAQEHKFDAEEALQWLHLRRSAIKVVPSTGKPSAKSSKGSKGASKDTSKIPLPFNGEYDETCCEALRQNHGLYTQCQMPKKAGNYCKGCATAMQKAGSETPEYGTIQDRLKVGIFEYVDPKGKRPTAYKKVMKKFKLSEADVLSEASKVGMNVNAGHFAEAEEEKKKGRPKKTKKVLEIEGDDGEDLFKTLLSEAKGSLPPPSSMKPLEEDVDDAASTTTEAFEEMKTFEEEMVAAAEAVEAAEKASKAKKGGGKKKQSEEEKALKAAEKAKKAEEEKARKAAEKEAEKARKAAEKEAEKARKAAEKASKAKKGKKEPEPEPEPESEPKEEEEEEEEEPEKEEEEEEEEVIKFRLDGEKYMRSTKTDVVYDVEGEAVGVWCDETKTVLFYDEESDEEREEEYDE